MPHECNVRVFEPYSYKRTKLSCPYIDNFAEYAREKYEMDNRIFKKGLERIATIKKFNKDNGFDCPFTPPPPIEKSPSYVWHNT